jgi:hypothetical protein
MRSLLIAAGVSALVSPVSPGPIATVPQYAGVYPARVMGNADPEQKGRLYLEFPTISQPNTWAVASAPYANGALPAVPPLGDTVWVQFEGGNPNFPVWIGWRP